MLKLIPFKPDPDGSLGSSGKEEALSQGGSDSAGSVQLHFKGCCQGF